MHWARVLMMTQVVRLFVGIPIRGSPLWVLFIRLNGARVGHNVWLNSTSISDHNLLVFGDNTVVGADVHLSGHTVEGGVVRTARVVVGSNVTIGVQSVIGIGVEIGDDCQVGALSFVPKNARLETGGTYGGIPVHRLNV
jgi:acetyltransferase-like isoleucine patch superfamily enzyme